MTRFARPFALLTVAALAVAACGSSDDADDSSTTTVPASVTDIDMSDYAFAVSGQATAGGTVRLRNTGQELHMMGVAKLKPGKTLDDMKTALDSDDESAFDTVAEERFLPGGILAPGVSVDVTTAALDAGSYALICYFPTEGEGAPHFVKGMIGQLDVVGGSPTAPTTDASYVVEPGKPITGPATLTAGKHTLGLKVSGDAGDLESILLKLTPGQTPQAAFEAVDAKFVTFEGETPPPKGFGVDMGQQLGFTLFDLSDERNLTLGVDLTPGTYALLMVDTDADPKDFTPAITITVT